MRGLDLHVHTNLSWLGNRPLSCATMLTYMLTVLHTGGARADVQNTLSFEENPSLLYFGLLGQTLKISVVKRGSVQILCTS